MAMISNKERAARKQRGFTLIELMVKFDAQASEDSGVFQPPSKVFNPW